MQLPFASHSQDSTTLFSRLCVQTIAEAGYRRYPRDKRRREKALVLFRLASRDEQLRNTPRLGTSWSRSLDVNTMDLPSELQAAPLESPSWAETVVTAPVSTATLFNSDAVAKPM
jgi:hypothetical protein